MSLPTADDLFRPTAAEESDDPDESAAEVSGKPAVAAVPDRRDGTGNAATDGQGRDAQQTRQSSGRVRHDEKMTVYVTADELLDLEHARLSLRRHQGVAVDRGRLVREALAIALADLEHNGDDSDLVKRLLG